MAALLYILTRSHKIDGSNTEPNNWLHQSHGLVYAFNLQFVVVKKPLSSDAAVEKNLQSFAQTGRSAQRDELWIDDFMLWQLFGTENEDETGMRLRHPIL